MSLIKKLLIIALVATSFYVGYGQVAGAMFGRGSGQGFFLGNWDTSGDYIFRPYTSPGPTASGCSGDGTFAIPYWVNSKASFINFIICKLNSNATYHVQREDRTGAAFVIYSMLGYIGCWWGTGNDCRPSDDIINDWAARINSAAVSVNWSTCVSWPINSLYQGNPVVSSSTPNDDTFYNSSGSACDAIVFSYSGQTYTIKRFCGNPVAGGEITGLPPVWNAYAYSTISDGVPNAGDNSYNISTRPGDTLSFNHYIHNNGPGSADIWYHVSGRNGASNPWTAQYYNNISLSGAPVLTRQENIIDYRDGVGTLSPAPGVNADNFSVRWTSTQNFTAGDYWFRMKTDDGGRLYVDGSLILDAWVAQGATPYSTYRTLAAGNHTITLEYFESGGPGWASLDYSNYFNPGGTDSGWYSAGQEKLVNSENYTVPAGATAGSQYCRRILWDWTNSSAAGEWGLSSASWADMVCATVVGDYNLQPTVTLNMTTAEPGDTVQFTYSVTKSGTSNSDPATCSITDENGATVSFSMPCNSPYTYTVNGTYHNKVESYAIPTGATPGTKYCRRLTIAPGSPTVPSRQSTLTCVLIAKTPYVRFMGGDVWAGGGFASANPACDTSAKITTLGKPLGGTSPTQYAGSTVEYQAFALNQVSGFGSGSRIMTGFGALGSPVRGLTYGNNEASLSLLGYLGAPQHCMTDFETLYASATPLAAGTYDVGTMGSGIWRVASGNLHLTGTMPTGATQLYLGTNNVFIDGNLMYPASYADRPSIPSLVVISGGNIAVASNVTRLDGIYVAQGDGVTDGMFRDCWPKTSPQAAGDACDVNQLTINGAVIAGSLELWRSYGANGSTVSARQEPAEIFQFSPEVYLHNVLNTANKGTIEVTNLQELPPRF